VVEGGGSKDFMTARSFLYGEPEAAEALLELLTDVQIDYLRMQHAAGADALMLFDSWVGLLSEEAYRRFAAPCVRRIAESLSDLRAPILYFPFGGSHLLDAVAELPVDVVGIDWRTPLDAARSRVGEDKAVQGNLDPATLFATPELLEEAAGRVLRAAGPRPGHVFNLGHGIDRRTDPEQVARLVDFVHDFRHEGG
jgi:uroporphyrinogen decarboxylase